MSTIESLHRGNLSWNRILGVITNDYGPIYDSFEDYKIWQAKHVQEKDKNIIAQFLTLQDWKLFVNQATVSNYKAARTLKSDFWRFNVNFYQYIYIYIYIYTII